MKRIAILAFVACAISAGQARADLVPVDLVSMGRLDQTVISRSATPLTGNFVGAIVRSSVNAGGSGGVWSGVDVDFIALSTSSVWGDPEATVVSPVAGIGTYVIQGSKRPGYAPTAKHPGPLFGLNPDGSIRHDVATLGTRDADYPVFQIPNLVDNSSGWVTLGDGGKLIVDFGTATGTWYLFLGEAATAGEPASVSLVTSGEIPEPMTLSVLTLGGLLAGARRRRR